MSGGLVISVIVPVFNRPQMVLDALASIAAQRDVSPQQVEIIVVDDGSQPVLDLPDAIGRAKLVRLSANKGTAAARNAGIEASTGEYLAFLDADDVWLAGKLAAQMREFARLATPEDRGGLALATGFYCPNWISGRLEGRLPEEASSLSDFVTGCWFAPGSTLFLHRSAFERIGLFDTRLRRLEDFDWFIRFGLKGGRLHVYPHPCAIIAPSGSSTGNDVRRAADLLIAKFGASGDLPLAASDRNRMHAYLHLETAAANFQNSQRLFAVAYGMRSMVRGPSLLRALWRQRTRIGSPPEIVAMYEKLLLRPR